MIFGFASTKNEVYIWLSSVSLKLCLYFASTFPLLSLYFPSTVPLLNLYLLHKYCCIMHYFLLVLCNFVV